MMFVYYRLHLPRQAETHPSLNYNDSLNWLCQINLTYHGAMLGGGFKLVLWPVMRNV